MGAKILTGIGCALFALSVLGLAVSLALPVLTNGRTSWEEAAPGYIGGAVCSALSFLPMAGGIVWLMMSRRKRPAA